LHGNTYYEPVTMFLRSTVQPVQVIKNIKTRWLYCVKCPQYSTRLEALGYLCDCVSRRVQR